jgi:hypothetical protein
MDSIVGGEGMRESGVEGDFLKQFNWRIFDRMGKAFSMRVPIPQNLTANTEIIPNPDKTPKFFIQPPIFATKPT